MIRYVGIDLHKHLIVGCVLDEAGEPCQRRSASHWATPAGRTEALGADRLEGHSRASTATQDASQEPSPKQANGDQHELANHSQTQSANSDRGVEFIAPGKRG